MTNNSLEKLRNAIMDLAYAGDSIVAQEAYNRLQEALNEEFTEADLQEAQGNLRDTVRKNVLSDALADYEAHSWLYPEHIRAVYDCLPVVAGKCNGERFSVEDTKSLRDIWQRFEVFAMCKSSTDVLAFVDGLSTILEQRSEIRDSGYRRLLWELQNALIGAYMDAFLSINRSEKAQYQMNLLLALEDLYVCAYSLRFLYFEDGEFQILSPEKLLEENDAAVLGRKLKTLRSALALSDMPAFSGYLERLMCEVSSAVLVNIQMIPEWDDVPEAAKRRAQYLGDLLRDELIGLTESVDKQKFELAEENFIYAQHTLHKLCEDYEASGMENNWGDFLLYSASSPDIEALSIQAVVALTVSLLKEVKTEALPDTLRYWVRFLLAIAAWPTSFTYNDEVFRWILTGEAA